MASAALSNEVGLTGWPLSSHKLSCECAFTLVHHTPLTQALTCCRSSCREGVLSAFASYHSQASAADIGAWFQDIGSGAGIRQGMIFIVSAPHLSWSPVSRLASVPLNLDSEDDLDELADDSL